MEALLVLLGGLVLATESVNLSLGNAVRVLHNKMSEEWIDFQDELAFRNTQYNNLQDENRRLEKKIGDLQDQRNELQWKAERLTNELSYMSKVLDNPRNLYRITWLANRIFHNKIFCIKAVRCVYPYGLKEAKELVEFRQARGEPLFDRLLTHREYLAVLDSVKTDQFSGEVDAEIVEGIDL